MKRIAILLLSAVVLASCAVKAETGLQPRDGSKTDAFSSERSQTGDQTSLKPTAEPVAVEIAFEAQYIRSGWNGNDAHPLAELLDSEEAFLAYFGETEYEGFERYDEAFFETHTLIAVFLTEGSGSIRHEAETVRLHSGEFLEVRINRIVPEVGTCDMAEWCILIEAKEKVSGNLPLKLYLDGNLSRSYLGAHEHAPATGRELPKPSEEEGRMWVDWVGQSDGFFGMGTLQETCARLLRDLPYEEAKLCRCEAPYTVQTEYGYGYCINPEMGFVRYGNGQADLTEEEILLLETCLNEITLPAPFDYETDAALYTEGIPGVKTDGFAGTEPTKIENRQQALIRAQWEHGETWVDSDVFYDAEAKVWKVNFYEDLETAGGGWTVWLDENGITLLVVFGE